MVEAKLKTTSPLWAFVLASLRAAFSFRGQFLISGISMTITNMSLYLPIYYLSLANGGFGLFSHEIITMGVAISLLSFTICVNFTMGVVDLQEIILSGKLDLFLLRPISLYQHLLMYRMNVFMIGEFIGSFLLLLLNPLHNWPYIFLASIIGGILFNHLIVLFNLTPFFFHQQREHTAWETVLTFHIYPPTIYTDFGRFVALYIFPGAMTSYGMLYLLVNPGFIWIFAPFYVGIIVLTHILLHMGIRKYTSAGY